MRRAFLTVLLFGAAAAIAYYALSVGESWPELRIPKLQSPVSWGALGLHSSSSSSTADNADHRIDSAPTETPNEFVNNTALSTIDENTKAVLVNSTAPSLVWKGTTTLVVAKLADDENLWVDFELSDLIEPQGSLSTAIYIVNDQQAELHPPENKGHEAIVYLTYIIDHYEKLPDISIFMHGHGAAWHNNDLLNLSSSLMVRHLNLGKVEREGYMNLRCHWSPGCPDWLHPNEVEWDGNKQEQLLFAPAWQQLFPHDPVPDVLSQPCCSQFAASRDTLLALPRQRYVEMRHWIQGTDLADEDSGRVFEYCWQFMFHNSTTFCPDPRICYCDGYGVCFEEQKDWDDYFEVQDRHGEHMDEWWKWSDATDLYHKQRNRLPEEEADPDEEWVKELPPPERGDEILRVAEELEREMTRRKNIALALGSDPADRARILAKTLEPTDHM